MNRIIRKVVIIMTFIATVTAALGVSGAAFAASNIYVNDSSNILGTDLPSAYAVGQNGVVDVVGDTYAITGTGTKKIETGAGLPSAVEDGSTVSIATNTLRVGLFWNTTAPANVSLANTVGSGYRFGYYNASRAFVDLGYTSATGLTVITDLNVSTSGGAVYCFHIKLPQTYSNFTLAQSAANQYGGFVKYENGAYRVLVGQYDNSTAAKNACNAFGVAGCTVESGTNKTVVVVQTGTNKILFEFDYGSTYSLSIRPASSSGKAVTKIAGNRTYYGDFQFTRLASGVLTVVNFVNIEDYLKGVVTYEMSASWPIEALKAQAVTARTYAMKSLNLNSGFGFDVTNDTSCQYYGGTAASTANSDAAVDQTAGKYITYNGALCSTFYYSANGGGSENSENVFVTALPYLKGVIDPYEAAATGNSYASWTRTLSKTTIENAVKTCSPSLGFGTFSSMSVTYSSTNNVIGITLNDTAGKSVTYSQKSCFDFCYLSKYLGLPSIHFTYAVSGDNIVFTGSGWGHSVGMSQYGAYAMAKVYGCNYLQIIRFYYTGVKISRGIV